MINKSGCILMGIKVNAAKMLWRFQQAAIASLTSISYQCEHFMAAMFKLTIILVFLLFVMFHVYYNVAGISVHIGYVALKI